MNALSLGAPALALAAALLAPPLASCALAKDLFYGHLYELRVGVAALGSTSIRAEGVNESRDGGYAYREGTTITVSAVPSAGAVFDSWNGSYDSFDPAFTFVISRDTDLEPVFVGLDDPWLVLVYMAAANDLEAEGLHDFNQIERGLYGADPETRGNRKVIVLFDRMAGGADDDGDWTGTRLFEASPDDDPSRIASTVIRSAATPAGTWRSGPDDEEAMGDRDTLASFVAWAAAAYPEYGRHALVLWNHGSGLLSNRALGDPQIEADAPRSVCFDDETKTADGYGIDGQLFIGELQEALSPAYGAARKLEAIGFDACYMGSYEVAYEFRDIARYFAGSPAEEYGGWNYASLLASADAFDDGAGFVREVVIGYKEKSATAPNTMTGFDLSVIGNLKTAIDGLAAALATGDQAVIEAARNSSTRYFQSGDGPYFPYHDLGSLCDTLLASDLAEEEAEAVKAALRDGVVYTWTATSYGGYIGANIPYGLSLFFSLDAQDYSAHDFYWSEYVPGYFGCIDAANSDSDDTVETWRELLEHLYDNPDLNTPGSW